ncbi:hypothetical protein GmRootV15_06130 [Variovorax sp. V15]
MEQVTLMLLLADRAVAVEVTEPKSMFEAAPAVTEQALVTVMRTLNVELAVSAIAALAARAARTAATMREGFFMRTDSRVSNG